MTQEELCSAYCEDGPVEFICEGCRIVRCPHCVLVAHGDESASPKGGSVEEKRPKACRHGYDLSCLTHPQLSRNILFLVIACLTLLIGCMGDPPTGPSSGDPREDFVLSETTRVANILKVHVSAKVTDQVYMVDCGDGSGQKCYAAGWYDGGKIYYWRKYLLTQPLSYGTAIAIHEVCHAKSILHDAVHAACINLVEKAS